MPPMARAESYGDIARLEQLLDEYGNVSAMDPAKVPALRGEIWTLIQAAQLDHDLGLDDRPDDAAFDEFVMHVDGWLCEIKDVQIRDGLHVLGQAPEGDELINLVLAILRSNQVFGGQVNRRSRACGPRSGSTEGASAGSGIWRWTESRRRPGPAGRGRRRRGLVGRRGGWRRRSESSGSRTPASRPRCASPASRSSRDWRGPRARSTRPCTPWTVGTCPAGPSGSPLRGLVNVLPTGRNFYSVDPKAIPSRLAYQTGQAMADSLLRRHLDETGGYPQSVGLVGLGHVGDADLGRRHRRGAGPARGAPGMGRGLPPGRRAGGGEPRRTGPAADRRHGADLRLLPGRLSARGRHARRRRPAGGRAGRAGRPNYVRRACPS